MDIPSRRRLRWFRPCVMLLLPSVLLSVGALERRAIGQVAFIPGPPHPVAPGPAYIAAADFNDDGIQDVAVSSTASSVVSVLLGWPDGSLRSLVELPVGRLLGGITTGDFNGDGASDIAVLGAPEACRKRLRRVPRPAQRGRRAQWNRYGVHACLACRSACGPFFRRLHGRVFVIRGEGNGTFGAPSRFPLSAWPTDIAAGNLDCPLGCSNPDRAGLDLVTVNDAANTMTLLFNRSGDKGFQSPLDIPTGPHPRSIAARDFNGDGADDIAVLTTGQAGADTLSIFLNDGTGAFSSVPPTNYPVGVAATALTVGDFDQDGVPDIAVLNGGDSTTRASISVLLNHTIKAADGTLRGTGSFTALPAFRIACPATLSGVPISCTPRDMISADFDADGLSDLAVSVSTRATTTGAVLAGFVNVYTGRGHGLFDFATYVSVGPGPRRIAPGDFTGDGVQDIAVTEYTSNTVRILRGIPPLPKPIAGACNLDSQCESGFCVNSACCRSRCAAGEFCNISGSLGTCSPPRAARESM